jgi:Protein of unknown function (DUF4231)
MSSPDTPPPGSAGRWRNTRARWAKRWLLGRQLARLDQWPPPGGGGEPDQTLSRLAWSITWHTLAHRQATRWYTALKVVQISLAAAIPVLATTRGSAPAVQVVIAVLGALVVLLEGVQQLKKYGPNAQLWAQGKEALKREYYLYQACTVPYSAVDAGARRRLLASRVEQIVGTEVKKWADVEAEAEDTGRAGPPGGATRKGGGGPHQ